MYSSASLGRLSLWRTVYMVRSGAEPLGHGARFGQVDCGEGFLKSVHSPCLVMSVGPRAVSCLLFGPVVLIMSVSPGVLVLCLPGVQLPGAIRLVAPTCSNQPARQSPSGRAAGGSVSLVVFGPLPQPVTQPPNQPAGQPAARVSPACQRRHTGCFTFLPTGWGTSL
jgi:hypothetical protein